MTVIDSSQLLQSAVTAFNNHVADSVDNKLQKLLGFRPSNLTKFFEERVELVTKINNKEELDDRLLSFLKTALVYYRLFVAEDVMKKSSYTFCEEVREVLDARLKEFDTVFNEDWFMNSIQIDYFEITNFISIQHAEQLFPDKQMKERKYDEKFHILNAPELFYEDLSYYRFQCTLRNICLNVAYIDIDDFKPFNSKYTEPRVNREIQPKFMSTIDAYLYHHGSAYRFGGDEYIIILPNMSKQSSAIFLNKLQSEIGDLRFGGIEDQLHVSMGLIEIDKGTYLTNHEVEHKAALAKDHAKKSGKNCISIANSTSTGIDEWKP